MLRHGDPIVAQQVRADRRLQRKTEDAVAGGVDQHGRGAVNHVTSSQLAPAGLKHVEQWIAATGGVRFASEDGKDGADADIDVDVTRAVEGIEDDNVLAVLPI